MRALILIAAAAVATSCSRPPMPPGSGLAAATAGRIAGPAQDCVSTNSAENLHVIDPQTVAYGYGRTIYINRLTAACPALSQFNTIIVDAEDGAQYCRGNRIRGREPGAVIPGPTCILGEWVPYTQR